MKRSPIIFVPDELEGDEPVAFPKKFASAMARIYGEPEPNKQKAEDPFKELHIRWELRKSLTAAQTESLARFHRLFGTVHTY